MSRDAETRRLDAAVEAWASAPGTQAGIARAEADADASMQPFRDARHVDPALLRTPLRPIDSTGGRR